MAESTNELYEIKESPGKGVGMFAKAKIPRGQLVIAEKPLFAIPALLLLLPGKTEEQYLSKLSPEERKSFESLTDAFHPTEPTFLGRVTTNSLPFGEEATLGGVFPIIARINHSCAPNVKHSWNSLEKVEKIYALKDIEQGEEILTSYKEMYRTREERRRDLKEKFNFECKCSACSINDAKALQESDRRRSMISELDQLVPIQATIQPLTAMRSLDKLLELLEEEGMGYDASSIARASYDYFSLLFQTGMTKNIGIWARRTLTNRIISDGPNSDSFLQARFKDELLRYGPKAKSKKN